MSIVAVPLGQSAMAFVRRARSAMTFLAPFLMTLLYTSASSAAAPKVLDPVTIIPINYQYGTPPTAEVQNILPSFYSDFTSQFVPNGIGAVLKEYGAGNTMSFSLSYLDSLRYIAGANPTSLSKLATSLSLGMQMGAPNLPDPACVPPASGNQAYSNYLYVLQLPPGVTLDTDPGCSFGGRHGKSSIQKLGPRGFYTCNFAWAYIVDVSPGNGNGCDINVSATVQANGLDFGMVNNATYIISHELMEAIVNPFSGPNPEIGDRCQGAAGTGVQGPWSTMPSNSGPPWLIASTWSVAQNTCWVSEQSASTGVSGYNQLTNTTIPSWTWDDESYKSSGFALARGGTHLDIFSVRATSEDGLTDVYSTVWDPATLSVPPADAWSGVDSSWRATTLPAPAIPASPELLDSTQGLAPVGSPVTAVSPTATSAYAFVAGTDQRIYYAYCTTGDGCRTTGSWNLMTPIVPSTGTYTIAPETPISAVMPANGLLQPPALFFAGANGEIFELRDLLFVGWVASQIAPPGSVPTTPHNALGRSYVSAISRYEVTTKSYEYNVFAAGSSGGIVRYYAPAGAAPFSSQAVTGSVVEPGTQIAALTRVPGQMDLFAVDANGAVQNYWWNELETPAPVWAHLAIMPAGTTVRGAGIAAVGWADHMNVFTTLNASGSGTGLAVQAFEELAGWNRTISTQPCSFTAGVPLQAVSMFRDRWDIFGLEADGTIDWQAASTQFVGLPVFPGDCNGLWNCAQGPEL